MLRYNSFVLSGILTSKSCGLGFKIWSSFFPVHKNQPNQKPLKYIWDLVNPGCTRCWFEGKNKIIIFQIFTGPCFSNAPQPHELIRALFGPVWMLVLCLWPEMGEVLFSLLSNTFFSKSQGKF
jgi:hypothetical protein